MHRSWIWLSRWADRRLPGLLLLAFLLLMSQLDSARATDIDAGLTGCGLRPLASEAPTHMACFEAID